MKITIQSKSAESSPIVIDVPDSNAQSTEAFGLPNVFAVKGNTIEQLFQRPKVKDALNEAKRWIEKNGYQHVTPAECKQTDKSLFAQIFRRGGGNKDGKSLDIHKGIHIANLISTGGANIDSWYNLIKSELKYFRAGGVTIQSTPILASFAEALTGFSGIATLYRLIARKKLRLLYICYKTSDGTIDIKPLCKVQVNAGTEETAGESDESAKAYESFIDSIFNDI